LQKWTFLNMNIKENIHQIQKQEFKKFYYLISLIFGVALIISCAIINYSLTRSICQTVEASYQQIENPLIREIYLEEKNAYTNIFNSFIINLKRQNIVPKLKLVLHKKDISKCSSQLFSIEYSRNIINVGEIFANISGTIFNLYSAITCLISALLFLISMIILHLGLNRLIEKFELIFIDPIIKLSLDKANTLSSMVPLEVHKIKNNIEILKHNIRQREKENHTLKLQEKTFEISSQVSHDIRSPLAALNMVATDLDILPETTRILLRGSINRIQDIANNLLQTSKRLGKEDNSTDVYLLSPIIEEIISEKRTQVRSKMGVEIESDFLHSYGLFVKINQSHLKRIFSNLINNSFEAFSEKGGKIHLLLSKENKNITIRIKDNGKGIPMHILKNLGKRGISFGKELNSDAGSGLGLYHAKTLVESWGGSFKIASVVGHGSEMTITLPEANPPSWFLPELILRPMQNIVIIDDDSSIHQVWDKRFEKIKNHLNIFHFRSPADAHEWLKINDFKSTTFLCDYEFIGEDKNGLDFIEDNKISKNSILVSSRYEKSSVRKVCANLQIKLIPKMMVELVPCKIQQSEQKT